MGDSANDTPSKKAAKPKSATKKKMENFFQPQKDRDTCEMPIEIKDHSPPSEVPDVVKPKSKPRKKTEKKTSTDDEPTEEKQTKSKKAASKNEASRSKKRKEPSAESLEDQESETLAPTKPKKKKKSVTPVATEDNTPVSSSDPPTLSSLSTPGDQTVKAKKSARKKKTVDESTSPKNKAPRKKKSSSIKEETSDATEREPQKSHKKKLDSTSNQSQPIETPENLDMSRTIFKYMKRLLQDTSLDDRWSELNNVYLEVPNVHMYKGGELHWASALRVVVNDLGYKIAGIVSSARIAPAKDGASPGYWIHDLPKDVDRNDRKQVVFVGTSDYHAADFSDRSSEPAATRSATCWSITEDDKVYLNDDYKPVTLKEQEEFDALYAKCKQRISCRK